MCTNEVLEHIDEKYLNESIMKMNRLSNNYDSYNRCKERGKMIINDPTHFNYQEGELVGKKSLRDWALMLRQEIYSIFPAQNSHQRF